MTDPVKEQLSACLDGELAEGELDLLLKQVAREPQLRASMGRYALIGETLRAQRPAAAPSDFASRVAAAIHAEPALAAPSSARPANPALRWLRPAAGFAVAAGVAAVAIVSVQPSQESTQPASYVAEVSAPDPVREDVTPDPSYIVPAGTAGDGGYVPAARLTNYVVAHSEYSTPLQRRSVLSGVLAHEEGDGSDSDDSTEARQSTDDPQQ